MKNKIIIVCMIFILLSVIIAFANSYVKALSRDEFYRNTEDRVLDCYNYCEQNENCPIYQENNYCIRQDNHPSHKNYDCIQDCTRQQNCSKRMCNR